MPIVNTPLKMWIRPSSSSGTIEWDVDTTTLPYIYMGAKNPAAMVSDDYFIDFGNGTTYDAAGWRALPNSQTMVAYPVRGKYTIKLTASYIAGPGTVVGSASNTSTILAVRGNAPRPHPDATVNALAATWNNFLVRATTCQSVEESLFWGNGWGDFVTGIGGVLWSTQSGPQVSPIGNYFRDWNNVTAATGAFAYNTAATTAHAGLFRNKTLMTNAAQAFRGCSNLTFIPDLATLFDDCPNITNFQACFMDCINLTGTAPALWNRSNVTSYTQCFRNCTKLTNYASIPDGWK